MSTDRDDLLKFLDHLADAAAQAIMPHFRTRASVENKQPDGFDPVTVADRAAEAAIRRLIGAHYPDHGIIGEEYGEDRPEAAHTWVIDPIDGTRAFITGLPVWGTLIGLLEEGRPTLGVMAQHFTAERFYGDGQKAWYRGRDGAITDLRTRTCRALAEASLFTTSPMLFEPGAERAAYDRAEAASLLARYGCDCYAYCMVAGGHADLVIEAGLKSFDIVALIPIVEGAGGCVTSWTGHSAAAGGRILASGDPALHEQAIAMLATQGK
ncbi:MAG: histidinol-phosphatase [Alphaproteobacteria bacterium]